MGVANIENHENLKNINLCVLLSLDQSEVEFQSLVNQLLVAGVRMIQLRDKKAETARLCHRTQITLEQAREHAMSTMEEKCIVVVNDRVDVAVATGADGVHLGESDLPVPLARKVCGHEFLIGRTAHSVQEAKQAVLAGADYLGVGPCFPTKTKEFKDFATDEFLREVSEEIRLPTFAIGGITCDNIGRLLHLGFNRFAVASSIADAADPGEEVRRMCSLLSGPTENRSLETP
jgi:thiamine-phosphate pyrophosphorylase